MKKDKKIKIVEELKDKIGKTKSLVLTDYRGLTHQQFEEIKKALRAAGADFMVTKNTLLRLALPATSYQSLATGLSGPTAALFSYQDEISPLPILAKFIKNFGLPQIKIGSIGEKILSGEEILRLASLPPREALMGQVIRGLKSPLYRITYALNWNLRKLTMILNLKTQTSNVPPQSRLRRASKTTT